MLDAVDARAALVAAGWSLERRVPISESKQALSNEGYETWPELSLFLENLSGLRLHVMRGGEPDEILIDAYVALSRTWKEWVDDYVRRAGVVMAPVGFAENGHVVLMLATDGRIFGGYDDYFGELGNDIVDAIQAIIDGERRLSLE